MLVAMLTLPGTDFAWPSEIPGNTPMVGGRVRAIEHVGNYVWVGGKFTHVQRHDGTVAANVSSVAVFDSVTDQYVDVAPKLGGTGSEVWDMALYGDTGNVLIAGQFAGHTSTQKNLVKLDAEGVHDASASGLRGFVEALGGGAQVLL